MREEGAVGGWGIITAGRRAEGGALDGMAMINRHAHVSEATQREQRARAQAEGGRRGRDARAAGCCGGEKEAVR
jgi:hypothetical protein